MNKPVNIREIILFGISIFLAYFLIRGCDTPIDKDKYISKELFDAANDSLHITRNNLGQEVTKTKLMSGTISGLMKLNTSKDSSIQKLLKLVDKKTIGATVISNTTSGSATTSTQVIPKDTIKNSDLLSVVYPEYKFNKGDTLKNKWEQVYATANKDSFHLYYKIFNEFDVVQKFERQHVEGKLFKKRVAVVQVTNLNPKTTTTELKSFVKEMPKPKKGLVFVGGILTGIIIKETVFNNKK